MVEKRKIFRKSTKRHPNHIAKPAEINTPTLCIYKGLGAKFGWLLQWWLTIRIGRFLTEPGGAFKM
jgi:hypothetical protein